MGTARGPSCRRRARVRAPAHVFASCFIVASWLRGIGAVTADDVDPFADANVDSRYGAFDHGTVERLLRSRLKLAGRFLEQSTFADASTRVSCTCSQYCEGQCFAPACAPCAASVWSFPGGADECFDPGPLGSGLLCSTANGKESTTPCCTDSKKSVCVLPQDACCSSGSCASCPSYRKMDLFPPLNVTDARTFDFAKNECREKGHHPAEDARAALLQYLKFRIRWERGIEKKRAKRRAAGLVADAADDDDEEEVQERRVEQKNVKQKMAFS